ncbi:FCD domain-containing protein [Nonomuraea sp. NPDC005501]|uniref:FCD domain-containing protein n=1 Tax=Nonomuraea sp. NPDC005501 TaxID=3156884 RepID=UPI0033B688B9
MALVDEVLAAITRPRPGALVARTFDRRKSLVCSTSPSSSEYQRLLFAFSDIGIASISLADVVGDQGQRCCSLSCAAKSSRWLCAEHDRLYEAIASGDPAAAGAVAVEHVNNSRATALRVLFDDNAAAATE